jgi:hypothetical protein
VRNREEGGREIREEKEKNILSSLLLHKRHCFYHGGPTLTVSSKPKHFPKVILPNTISLVVRASTYEFGWSQFNPNQYTFFCLF